MAFGHIEMQAVERMQLGTGCPGLDFGANVIIAQAYRIGKGRRYRTYQLG